jgi:hypothetical protein
MGVGVSSLLIILVVISMTVLAVLALLSAENDFKLTAKRQSYVIEQAKANVIYESALFAVGEAFALVGAVNADEDGWQIEWTDEETAIVTVPFHGDMAVVGSVRFTQAGVERQTYEVVNRADWEPDDWLDFTDITPFNDFADPDSDVDDESDDVLDLQE